MNADVILITMNKIILLTRPFAMAKQDAKTWQQAGFHTIITPLLRIEFIPVILPDLRNYQTIVTTSATAIQALACLTPVRNVPLGCVGKASATFAKSLGFQKIFTPFSGEGENARALLICLLQSLSPRKGPILYTAGEFTHLDLSTLLKQQGYTVEKAVLYRAQSELTSWPKIQSFFEKPVLGGVTFYSKRTASLFKEWLNSQKSLQIQGACYPLCLSSEIASLVKPFFACPSIITSTTEQLIANLKKIL